MKNKQPAQHPLDAMLQKIAGLLEQLIAVEMYRGGATQTDISASLSMSVGKVNKLVKGVKAPKKDHGEE
jgi:DNA-binding transcriptional regulator LsrR (DeoR family)